MKPRVLFVMGNWPNPSETFLRREMSALARAGLDFEILAIEPSTDPSTYGETSELTKRVWFLPGIFSPETVAGKAIAVSTAPLLFVELAGQLSQEGFASSAALRLPGVVWAGRKVAAGAFTRIHAQFASLPATVGYALAKWMGLPFSFSCHARDLYTAGAGLERIVTEADLVVTCTEYNRNYLVERFPSAAGKVHRVYHGIAPGRPAKPKVRQEVPLVLAVGRLVEKKGFADLVSACKLLTRRDVAYRCEIVGEGPLRGDLERFIRDLQPVQVDLVGWCSEDAVQDKMAEASVLVAPSVVARDGDRDGIPNVVLEAMATGTPVVASTISGIPEVVQDGRTGLLTAPGDVPGLAETITRLLANPALGEELAAQARELMRRNFDPEQNAAQLLQLLTRNG